MSKQSRLNKARAEKEKARASDDSRQGQSQPQQPRPQGGQRELWESSQQTIKQQDKDR